MASLHNKRTLVKTPWLFCMTFYLTNILSSNYFLIDDFCLQGRGYVSFTWISSPKRDFWFIASTQETFVELTFPWYCTRTRGRESHLQRECGCCRQLLRWGGTAHVVQLETWFAFFLPQVMCLDVFQLWEKIPKSDRNSCRKRQCFTSPTSLKKPEFGNLQARSNATKSPG